MGGEVFLTILWITETLPKAESTLEPSNIKSLLKIMGHLLSGSGNLGVKHWHHTAFSPTTLLACCRCVTGVEILNAKFKFKIILWKNFLVHYL